MPITARLAAESDSAWARVGDNFGAEYAAVIAQYPELQLVGGALLEAERVGLPLPKAYPDPRDVIIHRNMTVEIVEPIDEEGHQMMLGVAELRDIALSLLDITHDVVPECSELHLAIANERIGFFNSMLPPRLREYPPP